VINITPATKQPVELHVGEELSAEQRENFRSLLYDDFPELLQPVDSQPISRQCEHTFDTIGPMKHQRLNIYILSPIERVELNQKLRDSMEVGLIRPIHTELGLPILCA
jgi:hypothetical protein